MSILIELFGEKDAKRLCKAIIVLFIVCVFNVVVIAYTKNFYVISLSLVPTFVLLLGYLAKGIGETE